MATQSEIALTNITGNGSEHSENANSAETVTDLELQELIEKLTVRIDAANYAIGAATVAPPQAPPSPKHHLGINSNITVTIIALALVTGIGIALALVASIGRLLYINA